MAAVNIRRDVKDSFYRYKMPRLISKIEGKGNGIKTVVPNMSDIAKALSRPPNYVTKYFGCDLGAQVICDETNNRYIVNGAHDAGKLAESLDGFIKRFVLCSECDNPETVLAIIKDGSLIRDCKACGQRTNVDMTHKLVAFILKNPPGGAEATKSSSGKSGRKGSRRSKNQNDAQEGNQDLADNEDGAEDNDGGAEDEDGDDGGEELAKRFAAEAAELKQKESRLEDWTEQTDKDALGGLSAEMAKKLNLADEEMDENDPLEALASFVESKTDLTAAEIDMQIGRLGIRVDKAVAVLAQVLLDQRVLQQLPVKSKLFIPFLKSEKCQKAFLGGLERLIGELHAKELMSRTAHILKLVYELDLVEEEVMLAWGQKASSRYVPKPKSRAIREAGEPFLTWLSTAEADSSEEDDEDDEE